MKCKIFDNVDIKNISDHEYVRIRKAVPQYGVICLRGQSLTADELVSLTRRFGDPVMLPTGLRFNNTESRYPELARVSNILPDGTLLKEHSAAEYWHSDGDFWQPGKNYLFNLLYSMIVPQQGGATGFSDLRLAYASLAGSLKRRIRDLQVVVSCDEIPDFKDTPPEERQPDALHAITHRHVETGRTGLYFGHTFATIKDIAKQESDEIVQALVEAIEQPENQYVHHWKQGDLLIWDNTSVMHRSMGGYGDNPRLLYRTQAFIDSAALKKPRLVRRDGRAVKDLPVSV